MHFIETGGIDRKHIARYHAFCFFNPRILKAPLHVLRVAE